MGSSAGGFGMGDGGFTLVESLVVVIILGILAAIAIPTFLGQREQAQDAAAKSTVRNAATAILSYQTGGNGLPPGDEASVTQMEEIEPTIEWTKSQDIPVPLNDDSMVGAVPFERIGAGGVVFGTRSASGECFYTRIDPAGTKFGRDFLCNDPWETSTEGRISSDGW